jgi:hypothetical protein
MSRLRAIDKSYTVQADDRCATCRYCGCYSVGWEGTPHHFCEYTSKRPAQGELARKKWGTLHKIVPHGTCNRWERR